MPAEEGIQITIAHDGSVWDASAMIRGEQYTQCSGHALPLALRAIRACNPRNCELARRG